MRKYLIHFILIITLGCTDEFPVELSSREQKLVVEAVITDQPGPYYVRLTKSKSSFEKINLNDLNHGGYWFEDGFEPVLDALVVIYDNEGNVDTLVSSPDTSYYFLKDSVGNIIDTSAMPNEKGHFRGYYQTNTIKGKVGNTYTLIIQWQRKEYRSTCFMSPVPEIDSVTYEFTEGEVGKDDYYIPHIWFKDNPYTKDYYLFIFDSYGVWGRAILSDEYIHTEVKGLDIFRGASYDSWRVGYPPLGTLYSITMASITKEIYMYYRALILQFKNDGGVYSPTPASPPTNISNGALGYFRASAVRMVTDTMPYYPLLKKYHGANPAYTSMRAGVQTSMVSGHRQAGAKY
ncbi:MAG: DUF4249 domain-containing protein [Bacteroidales bacterium]|nr:DUF4249 domain-containing protein [Bacteroidales bacterium]